MLPLIVVAVLSAAPDWCKPLEKERPQSFSDNDADADDAWKASQVIVYGLCVPRDDTDGPRAEKLRAKWGPLLEMEDADWAAAAEYWGKFDKYDPTIPFEGKDITTYTPGDLALHLSRNNGKFDGYYLADVASPLGESARLGFVLWCLGNHIDEAVHLAACADDIAKADLKKAAAELRADKRNPRAAFWVRARWYEFRSNFTKAKARIEALKKEDEGYAKMFDLAAKTTADWEANRGKRSKLLALATEMDVARDSNSKKAMKDCEAKTLTALRDAVGGIPAKSFQPVIDLERKVKADGAVASVITSHPEGSLAATAYVNCLPDAEEKSSKFLRTLLGTSLERWPGYRGPRNAVLSEVLKAGIELDQRGAELKLPDFDRTFFPHGYQSSEMGSTGVGVVKALKAGTVTYETRAVTEPVCVDYHPGKAITGFNASTGQFERASSCGKYKMVTDNHEVKPNTYDARFVSGVKPGANAVFVEGVPYATWAKGAKQVSTVLGVPVK